MLKYLENNFVLAAVVSILSLIGMYLFNRNSENETSKLKIYLKHSLLVFVLVLMVLYYRTKSKISLKGGGSSIASSLSAPAIPVENLAQNVNIGDPNF